MLASDLMTPAIVLKETESVRSAAELFVKHRFKVLPIVDQRNKMVGLITQISLLDSIVKSMGTPPPLLQEIKSDFSKVTCIPEDAPIDEIYRSIQSSPHRRAFVANEQAAVVGVVSPTDLMARLLGAKESTDSVLSDFLEMKKSRDTIGALLDSSPIMMMGIDYQFRLEYANQSAKEALGINLEAPPLGIEELFAKADQEKIRRLLRGAYDAKYIGETAVSMSSLKGPMVPVMLQISKGSDPLDLPKYLLLARPHETTGN